MKTLLVTGAAGFIGSNLTEALLKKGYSVIGLDNLSQGHARNIEGFKSNKAFEFHQGDVRDAALVAKLVDRADCVVHLAAFKIPRYSDAYDTLMINSDGTKKILEAASKRKIRVVTASTSDCYGRNPEVPFHEGSDMWLGPSTVKRWAYAASKLYDEHLAYAYQEEFGVPVVIMRFFGGYGPRQNTTWWGGPQAVFIDAALKNQEMEVHGDGKQTRSFTFIGDHVDGIIRCIEKKEAVGQVFNLGYTEEITIRELAELVWKLARQGEPHSVPKIKMISYRSFGKYEDVRRRVPDISKARELLGFEPKTALEEGLKVTIDWQKSVIK